MRPDVVALAAVVGFALTSMVPYALGASSRTPDADAVARGGSFALGSWVRDWFYWFIGPVERGAIALHLSPDFFNFLGLALSLASMVVFWSGGLPAAGWLLLMGGVADILDGRVARARGVASDYGAFIDSTLDRFAEFVVFVGIAAFYGGRLPVLVVVLALGGSLLVSYTRARGESLGVVCKAGVMQRAERMLALAFGAILDPWASDALGRGQGDALAAVLGLIALGTVGTAVYRTVWIARRLRRR
jgi:CDP-diacylglycerol--glycerol-3-phosphate 3-phosphatidyltransferase